VGANTDNLKTALIAKAGEIAFDLDRLECLALIDDWYAASVARTSVGGGTLSSYSLNGRTFTKHDLTQLDRHVEALYAQIKASLYGNGHLIDMSGSLDGVLP